MLGAEVSPPMSLFAGLSAFPITPTNESGKVNAKELRGLLDRLVAAKVNSIGLLGSTGGYAYLSRKQRSRAIETAVKRVRGRVPVIVGVGALRTDQAVDLARDAEEAGADGLLLAPVSYTPLTQDEVFHHFATVADVSELPLCIYNNPVTTNFSFNADLLKRLAEIENIQAVKMPLPKEMNVASDLERLRKVLPGDFLIGYSGDWGCSSALLSGADCWFSVVAGLLPEPSMKLTKAAVAGDISETQRINGCFAPLWELFQELSSLRVVYAMANLMGLTEAAPHLPILPVAYSELERVESALEALEEI